LSLETSSLRKEGRRERKAVKKGKGHASQTHSVKQKRGPGTRRGRPRGVSDRGRGGRERRGGSTATLSLDVLGL